MILFRVFALMIDLKIVVEVGLVTGTIPAMTPMVPFTHLRSKLFLIKMICAPGYSTSSSEVGRLLSGKSHSMPPSNVLGSPGSSDSFFSLIKYTVSSRVA